MIEFHAARGAEATVAAIPVDRSLAVEFGVIAACDSLVGGVTGAPAVQAMPIIGQVFADIEQQDCLGEWQPAASNTAADRTVNSERRFNEVFIGLMLFIYF